MRMPSFCFDLKQRDVPSGSRAAARAARETARRRLSTVSVSEPSCATEAILIAGAYRRARGCAQRSKALLTYSSVRFLGYDIITMRAKKAPYNRRTIWKVTQEHNMTKSTPPGGHTTTVGNSPYAHSHAHRDIHNL